MIFNNEAYEEVYPRVAPAKLQPKRETMLPDPDEDIEEVDSSIEVESPETPETDPEEGASDDAGSSDTAN